MMNDILEDLRMGDDFRNKQEPMEVLAIDFIRKFSNSPVNPEMVSYHPKRHAAHTDRPFNLGHPS
jgi:hypothetical protein